LIFIILVQRTDPYISITNPAVITMILKAQRSLAMCLIFRPSYIRCGTFDLCMILNKDTVMQYCYCSRFYFPAKFVELWSMVDNIIAVPLSGRNRGHCQGGTLFV